MTHAHLVEQDNLDTARADAIMRQFRAVNRAKSMPAPEGSHVMDWIVGAIVIGMFVIGFTMLWIGTPS